ncbi:MAG: (d)CMP kinase [Acidimicrobiales bacterium]
MSAPVVAIDGPSGSGKSTVARLVARRLGLDHLDTGAMYRAVAFAALRRGVAVDDAEAVAALAAEVAIDVGPTVVTVDGVDATAAIRGPQVTAVVSAVAANPAVRAELVRRQRAWLTGRAGAVADGRDTASVVFPGADLKVYLTASEAERARRRAVEHGAPDVAAVTDDLARRDRLDSTRSVSPLLVADGALVVDTTGRSIEAVVEEILAALEAAREVAR